MSRHVNGPFIWLLCMVLLIGVLPITPVQAHSAVKFEEVDSIMSKLMDMYSVPGAAIALVQNDKVVYSKGYGLRDVHTKDPVTENTVFAIGSVTKSFTALAVMQLVEQGKIDLDTPVIKYVPDFKLADPDLTKTLTVRQIISHSSGLPRADDLWYQHVPASRKQVIQDMAQIKPTAKPDTMFQYCNQNFVLAGYLVEQITGQTWEEYVQQHIFDSLGMKSANFNVVDTQKGKDYSFGYLPDVLHDYSAVSFDKPAFKSIVPVGPAGSINVNVLDMAQWVRLQLGDGTFNGKPIISSKSLTAMHTQHITLAGSTEGDALRALSPEDDLGYGFAWFTGKFHGYAMANHGGEIDGFTSDVTLVPSQNIGLVILTNANSAVPFTEAARLLLTEVLLGLTPNQDMIARINKAILFDPVAYKANVAAARAYKSDPKDLEKYAGDYTGVGGNFSLVVKDGLLHMIVTGKISADNTLVQFAPDNFLLNGTLGVVLKLTVDDQGTGKVFQGTTEVGQRPGKNVKVVEYKDPQGRFTTTLPDGVTLEQKGDLAVLTSKDPAGTILMGALPAGHDDLDNSASKVLKLIDPKLDLKPINKRDVPVNSLTWTQYLYQLPSGDLVAVEIIKQGDNVYFIAAQAGASVIQSLAAKLNTLLLNFKIAA